VNVNFRPLSWLSLVGTSGIDQVTRHDYETVGPNEVRPVVSSLIRLGYRDSTVEVSNYTNTVDATGTFSLTDNWSPPPRWGRSTTARSTTTPRRRATACRRHHLAERRHAALPADENTVENATVGVYGQQQLAFTDAVRDGGRSAATTTAPSVLPRTTCSTRR
jgi:hypothetical protein